MMSDPYAILGVSANASDEEIAKAYKKLAKRYHPDLNPGNSAAAEQMGRINQAYDQIKSRRQSGNRQNTANAGAGFYGAEPFTAYYSNYRSYGSDYTQNSDFRRRSSPFRLAMAVALVLLLLRLVASLIGGTAAMQHYLYGDGSGSSEPYYGYYSTYRY